MGYMMAGLLSGIGQGIAKAGDTLEKRREAALDWANKLQAAQEAQTAETQRATLNNDRADKRLAFTEGNTNMRTAAQLDATAANQQAGFTQQLTMEQVREQAQQRLARLQNNLEIVRDAKKHALEEGDNSTEVKDVVPGPLDDNGNAHAIVIFKDGTTKDTGVVYNPGNNVKPNYGRPVTAKGGKANPFGGGAGVAVPGTPTAKVMRFDGQGNLIQ